MEKTTPILPPLTPRDIFANVIQLCDYVEDMRVEPGMLKTFDYGVLRAKAKQVKQLIEEKQ